VDRTCKVIDLDQSYGRYWHEAESHRSELIAVKQPHTNAP